MLADLLWDKLPPERARANLSVLLTGVRHRLGDYLETSRLTVGLRAARPLWLDVAELERQIDRLMPQGAALAPLSPADAALLQGALSLYHGDFLAGFALSNSYGFEDWARAEQERLRQAALRARQLLVVSYRAHGQVEAAIAQAELAAQMDPLQEWAPLQLMELLTGAGRRAAALEAYERHRQQLQSELGIAPGEALQQLYQRVRAGAALAPAGSAPRLGARPGLRGAPPQISPFVGREPELAQIAARLADPACRLLTLVGPGGVGKTRLAAQAAALHCAGSAVAGVFVPLAPVGDPAGVPAAVAAALGLQLTGHHGPGDPLIAYLREHELLLLLDNCEHLAGLADLAAAIIAEAPGVRVLATSQAPLGLGAEWLVELPGLSFPAAADLGAHYDLQRAAAFSAVQLFARRAAQLQPGFALDAETLPAVAAICRLLDGMPLAIELAATSARHLSCAQIAEAIVASLDVLASELRDLPPRHRSLRAVFEHAWGLLDASGRAALARLSTFRGGFTAPAAAAVLGLAGPAALAALGALIDRSLIRRDPAGRYDIHGLVLQYAGERLRADPAEASEAAARHSAHYAGLLLREGERLRGADLAVALAAIGAEADNIRAAWERALAAADWARAAAMLDGLWAYLDLAGLFEEGYERLGRAAAALEGRAWEGEPPAQRIADAQIELPEAPRAGALDGERGRLLERLLARRGALCERMGRYVEGAGMLRRALRLAGEAGDLAEQAMALTALGRIADRRGRYHTARRLSRRGLACATACGDSARAATALYNLASAAEGLREYGAALPLAARSLELRRAGGDLRGEGHCLNLLGLIAEMQGDSQAARAYYQQSLAIFARLGNRWEQTIPLSNLGDVYTGLGELGEARRSYDEALRVARELWVVPAMLMNLVKLAQLLQRSGEAEQAAELLALPLSHPATEQSFREQARALLADLNAALAPEPVSAALARGRGRTLAEAVAALL